MNDDLETELRRALRPVAPSDQFAERVAAAVGTVGMRSARRGAMRNSRWLRAGIAASVMLALGLGFGLEHRLQEQREIAAGLEARRQVIMALRVTHAKLDLAYQSVMTQAEAGGEP